MKTILHMQGMGRHTRDEIHQMGKDDIDSIADFLADKTYFMGDKPTRIDGMVYGTIASIAKPPFPTPLRAYVKSKPKLMEYCDRVEKTFFSGVLK
jgi:glutathione S-transferase